MKTENDSAPVIAVAATPVEKVRAMTRGAYDIQKLRIAFGNRIVGNFKVKLGMDTTKKEDDEAQDTETKKLLKRLKADYKKITDGVKREIPTIKEFKAHGLISEYAELCLMHSYMLQEANEEQLFDKLEVLLEEVPIYTEFLKGIPGCGKAMSGAIIASLDPHEAPYPSSFWQYTGLSVHKDGKGMSKRKEHLVEKSMVLRDGSTKKWMGANHNVWIKSKLFVLAECLIRAGNRQYRKIYDDYKHRLQTDPKWAEKTKAHIHRASLRYMIKMFLVNLHRKWRELEGLPVTLTYHEAKHGHFHGKAA